jgi:hypothetical protein
MTIDFILREKGSPDDADGKQHPRRRLRNALKIDVTYFILSSVHFHKLTVPTNSALPFSGCGS